MATLAITFTVDGDIKRVIEAEWHGLVIDEDTNLPDLVSRSMRQQTEKQRQEAQEAELQAYIAAVKGNPRVAHRYNTGSFSRGASEYVGASCREMVYTGGSWGHECSRKPKFRTGRSDGSGPEYNLLRCKQHAEQYVAQHSGGFALALDGTGLDDYHNVGGYISKWNVNSGSYVVNENTGARSTIGKFV
jgi:hypothetical protein